MSSVSHSGQTKKVRISPNTPLCWLRSWYQPSERFACLGRNTNNAFSSVASLIQWPYWGRLVSWKTVVPSKGLEPPHPCGYMDLNHARLPIPPRWQVDLCCSGGLTTTTGSGRPTFLFYRGTAGCQTSAATPHAKRLLLQLRVHGDVRVQHLRYRTALLGVFGRLAKRGFIGLGYSRGHIQLHGRDGPARIQLLHGQSRRGRYAFRCQIRVPQLRRQRH